MRILMLSWEYPPNVVGGLGRHVAELVPALAQQGIDIHVITPVPRADMGGVAIEDGVSIHRVVVPILKTKADIYSQTLEVNHAIDAYVHLNKNTYGPFDCMHTHDWLTGFAGVTLQRTLNCPLIATIHATERGRSRNHLTNELQQSIDHAERDLVTQARHVIVCSQHMATEVQYFFQIPPEKIDSIPNGVNLTNLHNGYNLETSAGFRARFAAPDDQIVFTVSRLVYEKGIHLLIQAAPRILETCPRARFVVAGKGPEADNLRQQAQNLGVADRVNLIGFVSDEERNHLFKVADCSVFPSLYEPFGIVALEAMALGSPLVVSDVGGFSEVVKHAETGIKIYPDNVESTAWGIVQALSNPDWSRQHTVRAYRSLELLFNWPRIARLTKAVYERVVADHSAS